MIQLKNVYKIWLIFVMLASTGCSRTITSKSIVLNIRITLTCDGPIDFNKFNYYLFFSKSGGIKLPANSSPFLYFPTPGRTFNQDYLIQNYGGLLNYYNSYYSTWSDYMVLSYQLTSLYQSGGSQFTAPTTTQNGQLVIATDNFFFPPKSGFSPTVEVIGNTITITFPADQIAATVEKNTNTNLEGYDSGEFRDCLAAPVTITLEQNNTIYLPQSDSAEPAIKSGSDLIGCRIQIL
ncbi:hypothetical protein EB093_03615 [bacterium]|nr:hypothetical protein [bacterium]